MDLKEQKILISTNKLGVLAGVILFGSSLCITTSVFAADLLCVQKAVNWNKIGRTGSLQNVVRFSTVTLHSNGIAAYATGKLQNIKCSFTPVGIGTTTCLASDSLSMLLSDRAVGFGNSKQPFDVNKPLPLQVLRIPPDSLMGASIRQPNATYKFNPECVGNLLMLTGNDQFANHWTMSFQLALEPIIN